MKKALLLLIALIFSKAEAQKMYIWCPGKLTASPRKEQLKNIEVNVLISDTRLLTNRPKDKCDFNELSNSIFELIKTTYPSAITNKVADNENKIENGKIQIEINITAYYATFTSAMWFAKTEYSVKIIDSRADNKKESSNTISKEKSFFNVGGFGTAKKKLNESYREANVELLSFLSSKLT